MNICILMGSPRLNGNTAELLKPFEEELRALGAEVHTIAVAEKQIAPCRACYVCQTVEGRYGCVIDDDMQAIVDAVVAADLLVLATPIFIWYCPAQLKAVLDRFYGMNKYYRTPVQSSLWWGKSVAILATHGYDASHADPFEAGIRHFCTHSKLHYRGMYSVRDINDKPDFQTPAAMAGARDFAQALVLGKK